MAPRPSTLLLPLLLSPLLLLLTVPSLVQADPEPINDFAKVNATAADFVYYNFSSSLTSFPAGATGKTTVDNFPGVAGLGLTNAIYVFGINAVLSPHWHPRGSEMVYVLEGVASVGFIDTKYVLRKNIIKAGDVTIFPRGLLHWIENIGNVTLKTFHSLDGQDAGTILLNRVIRDIDAPVMRAAFNVSMSTVAALQNPLLKPLMFKT